MKTPPDDFDDLLKLLSVKRYEQPPPDFFADFPQQVMERLQTLEPEQPKTWWQRCWEEVGLKPVLAGAYCVAVSGLLLAGLSLSQMIRAGEAEEGLGRIYGFQGPLPEGQWITPSLTDLEQPANGTIEPVLAIEPISLRLHSGLRLKAPKWEGLFQEGR